MRAGVEFTRPCATAAYAPDVGTPLVVERTVEHLVLNIAVVAAFFFVVKVGLRLADRF